MNQKHFIILTGLVIALVTLLTAIPALADPTLALSLPGFGTVQLSVASVVSFDQADDWEAYSSATGTQLDIENHVYRASTLSAGYAWGLNAVEHSDIVLETDVTPLTIYSDTAAGIMCRADESDNGDGYYFMVNGNGYYSIRIGKGSGIDALIDWTPSKAIHTGIDRNIIRAVCLQNQLAMYVNDELVGSVIDDTYSQGFTGLAVAGGDNGTDMAFDSVTFYRAQLTSELVVSR